MKARTQLARRGWLGRRASGLVASVFILLLLVLSNSTVAQEGGTNQAGVVIQFSDGSVHTACVELGPDGQATGEEVLRASGTTILMDYSSGMGVTVCKIGNTGCNFPTEKCFCQCTMKPGDPCVYWTYFHLLDGQWRYASLGASSYTVRPGDVEGWVWGPGAVGGGTQPPLIPFEQICSAPSAAMVPPSPTTEPSPSTATWTPLPPSTVTAVPPTATSTPTSTSLPPGTSSPNPTSLPETPVPSPSPSEVTTETTTATSMPSATPTMERVVSAASSPTQAATTSVFIETQQSPAGAEQSPSASQGVSGASIETGNYVFFGALVGVLVVGLIALRVRQ
jgi:hypothetical protein